MCPGRREVIGTGFVDGDFCDDAVAKQVEQIGGNLSVREQAKERVMLTPFPRCCPNTCNRRAGLSGGQPEPR